VQSYQQGGEESYLDPDIIARRRAERLERNKDDPFYIAPNDSGQSTPIHNILQSNNGPDLDIDSIPIMQLDLGQTTPAPGRTSPKKASVPKTRQRVQVAADETLGASGASTPRNDDSDSLDGVQRPRPSKGKHSLLQVDSSHIGAFSLEGDDTSGVDYEAQQREDAEMTKAMQEIEKLRLEMQRANERIEAAQGVEGVVVKKKKKKVKAADGEEGILVKKKKKKVKPVAYQGEESGPSTITEEVVKPKKKKKKIPIVEGASAEQEM